MEDNAIKIILKFVIGATRYHTRAPLPDVQN